MRKLLWILNPKAGRGVIAGKMVECLNIFQNAGYETTAYATQKAQDAVKIVQERAEGFDRIVCAGGDGTLSEVVTGLMGCEDRPPLGYIPAGTTNDFALSLGIPRTVAEAAKIAVGNTLQALDVGKFNEQYFNYVAAFGIFTEVSYATPQQTKNIFGRAAYILEGIKSLVNIRTHHLRVSCDGLSEENDFIYGMVSNTRSVGGFKLAPNQNIALDDGLYEVLLVRPVENPMELQWLANDLLTRNMDSNRFVYCRTSHIVFEADNEVPWTLDGEFGGSIQRAEINNFSRAITFVTAPPEAAAEGITENQ